MRWRLPRTADVPAGFDPRPLSKCALCGRPLPPNGPSLWFCGSPSACQYLWYAARAHDPWSVNHDELLLASASRPSVQARTAS